MNVRAVQAINPDTQQIHARYVSAAEAARQNKCTPVQMHTALQKPGLVFVSGMRWEYVPEDLQPKDAPIRRCRACNQDKWVDLFSVGHAVCKSCRVKIGQKTYLKKCYEETSV